MKKIITIFMSLLLAAGTAFAETVVVLDFDTEIQGYEKNASIMSDMLRSELVKIGNFDIVDRKTMSAAINEMQSQLSGYMETQNVAQLGKMLNADHLIIGHVHSLSNKANTESDVKNIFLNKAEEILIGSDKVEVVAQLVEIETLKVLSSSSVELKKWTDFSKYTRKMAYDLTVSLLGKDSIGDEIFTNIKKANEEMLQGSWAAEVSHDGILDYYEIKFEENHKVSVKVTSVDRSGKETKSEGTGRYVFNDSEKILSVSVNRLNGKIKHLKSIEWKSFVNPGQNEKSFSYSIPSTFGSKTKLQKCEFFKE